MFYSLIVLRVGGVDVLVRSFIYEGCIGYRNSSNKLCTERDQFIGKCFVLCFRIALWLQMSSEGQHTQSQKVLVVTIKFYFVNILKGIYLVSVVYYQELCLSCGNQILISIERLNCFGMKGLRAEIIETWSMYVLFLFVYEITFDISWFRKNSLFGDDWDEV